MLFAPDTEVALRSVVNLINSSANGDEHLSTTEDLDRFLEAEGFTGSRTRDAAELASVHRLRGELAALWLADEATAVDTVNRLLREANALPQLVKHDQWDWHLHVTRPDAPLAHRLAAEAAMGFLDLVREDDLDRLKICAADDCQDVLVDLSRNSSKRYCDTGNCGNRTNVAAYRARKRKQKA